jgi:hypothetical protein
MLPTRKQYLTFVASQLGTRESPPGSNRQKYGVAYGMDGVAWCQEFDWWCAHQMGVPHLKTASTMAAVAEARKKGTWHAGTKGIQPGDSVYFHWPGSSRPANQPDHVEICEKVVAGGVQAIGGNVSDCVHRQIRRANFLGYIAHEFAPAPAPVPPVPTPKPPVPVPAPVVPSPAPTPPKPPVPPAPAPKPIPTVEVIASGLALWQKPSRLSKRLLNVPKGAHLPVKAHKGKWLYTSYHAVNGWVCTVSVIGRKTVK